MDMDIANIGVNGHVRWSLKRLCHAQTLKKTFDTTIRLEWRKIYDRDRRVTEHVQIKCKIYIVLGNFVYCKQFLVLLNKMVHIF